MEVSEWSELNNKNNFFFFISRNHLTLTLTLTPPTSDIFSWVLTASGELILKIKYKFNWEFRPLWQIWEFKLLPIIIKWHITLF